MLQNTNTSCRNLALDYAKAIGIILMIIGHGYSRSNAIICWIYSFHMPLFFIIAGIFMGGVNNEKKIKFRFSGKFKRLLMPYFLSSFCYALFLAILQVIHSGTVSDLANRTICIVSLYGISAAWFLPCLFLSELLFAFLYKFKTGIVIMTITLFLGLLIPAPQIFYIETILRCFVGMGFIAVGYFGKKIILMQANRKLVAVLTVVHLLLSQVNGTVGLGSRTFGNVIFYILNSILGSYVLIQICVIISEHFKLGILRTIGMHTLFILCSSSIVIEIVRLADYKLFGNFLPSLSYVEGFALCFVVMIIDLAMIFALDRFAAFMQKVKIK